MAEAAGLESSCAGAAAVASAAAGEGSSEGCSDSGTPAHASCSMHTANVCGMVSRPSRLQRMSTAGAPLTEALNALAPAECPETATAPSADHTRHPQAAAGDETLTYAIHSESPHANQQPPLPQHSPADNGDDGGSTGNSSGSTSASSRAMLAWPPGWHWPLKLLRASASGLQHVQVSSSAQHGQQRPSELLTALHSHLMRRPAVAAALQQAVAVAAEATAALDESSAGPLQLVQESLQQQLEEDWAAWDRDGDGLLSGAELDSMLQQVLPPGSVGSEQLRYFQVMLDRSGCGGVSVADVLAAAHTAVGLCVGLCPKPRVDVQDVLLCLAVQLVMQQQPGQGAGEGFASLVAQRFGELDSSHAKQLGASDLTRLCKSVLPGLNNKEVRHILGHMTELEHGSGRVTLKSFIDALQPVHQVLQAVSHHADQQAAAGLRASWLSQAAAAAHAAARDASDVWRLPQAPAPVRVGHGFNSCSGGSTSCWPAMASSGPGSSAKPVPWPMQELASLLASDPAGMHLAFMQTAAAAAARSCCNSSPRMAQSRGGSGSGSRTTSSRSRSSSGGGSGVTQQLPLPQQQRYSLVPIAALPHLLAVALPSWGGADISYAALQVRCHMNIVANWTLDSPMAAACGSNGSTAAGSAVPVAEPPSDMMFAELAATIVSAAATEAAVATWQLPQAVQQLLVDLTDELVTEPSAQQRVAAAWDAAAAAAAAAAGSEAAGAGAHAKLPVTAAVKLCCRVLVGTRGLSDIRLLGWLTCLVRRQHMQQQQQQHQQPQSDHNRNSSSSSSTSSSLAGAAVSAELTLQGLVEVLLLVVQALLPADDAALLEEYTHQQQGGLQGGGSSGRCDEASGWCWRDEPGSGASSTSECDAAVTVLEEQARAAGRSRRERIVFNGSSPAASETGSAGGCVPAPCWHQQGSRDSSSGGLAQMHGWRDSGSTPGQPLMPLELQQQREQLQRLRAAQLSAAWQAEMALAHQPWEGAYSPVASTGGARGPSSSSGGGGGRLFDILRLSSTAGCSSGASSRTCSNGC